MSNRSLWIRATALGDTELREWRQLPGFQYEAAFPGLRRIFTTEKEVVFAAERDGKPYLIIDESTGEDLNASDFEENLYAPIAIIDFRHTGERVQYLNQHYQQWRSQLESDWNDPAMLMDWESWSLNGEACIGNHIPSSPGSEKVAEYLWWMLREFAGHCRRFYNATDMIPFEFHGPRTPSAFAKALDDWFDLALLDPISIHERVRRLGGDADAVRWPAYWVERKTILLLAEERQVNIPAEPRSIGTGVRRKWESCLDVVAGFAGNVVPRASVRDRHSFLAGVLVAVHRQAQGKVRERPSLDDSIQRHLQLVASLEPVAEAKSRPVTWHGLWRLPPGMVVEIPFGTDPWMHYPAVSLVASVFPCETASAAAAPAKSPLNSKP